MFFLVPAHSCSPGQRAVKRKPVIVQQLTALAPYSHIRAGSGFIAEPSDGHADEDQIPATLHSRKPEIARRS